MQQQAPSGAQESSFCGLDHFTCCLAVFDSRLGQREGQEDDKVLAFFPSSIPPTTRTMIVGLAQALHGFNSTFMQVETVQDDPVFVMEAQHNTWVLHQCEPSIWIMAVVSKAWLGSSITHAGLRAYLRNVYAVTVLLHGPIQGTLDQAAPVLSARRALQPLVDEAGRLLLAQGPRLRLASAPGPLTREASALANPLGLHRGVPLLVVPEVPYLGAQCLSSRLLNLPQASDSCPTPRTPDPLAPTPFSDLPVLGVHIAWHGMPVWSTLSCEDAAALHVLMQRALLPAAGIGRKKANPLKAALAAAAAVSTTYILPSTTSSASAASTPLPSPTDPTDTLLSPTQWSVIPPVALPPTATAGSTSLPTPFQPQSQPLPPVASFSQASVGSVAGRGLSQASSRVASTILASVPGASSNQSVPPTTGTGGGIPTPTGWLLPISSIGPAVGRTGPSSVGGGMPGDSRGAGAGPGEMEVARVWLQAERGHVGLLPFYYGPLMVALLLRPGTEVTAGLLEEAQEVLMGHVPQLASQLQSSLPPSSNLWHQKGYRYSHEDSAADATRATPIKKMTTLGDATLRLAARTRNKLDQWTHATSQPSTLPGSRNGQAGVADAAGATGVAGLLDSGVACQTGARIAPAGVNTVQGLLEGGAPGSGITSGLGLLPPSNTVVLNAAAGTGAQPSSGIAGLDGEASGPPVGADGGGAGLGAEGDYEVVIRTSTDAWVVVRRAESRCLRVALDQAPVPSLLGVSAHVQKLCNRIYPGYFVGFN